MPYKDPTSDAARASQRRRSARYIAKNPDGWRQRSRDWYSRGGKEKAIDYNMRYLYGITLEEKRAMIAAQLFMCAGCEAKINESSDIDHCHETGVVRGVLCRHCNLILGLAKDSASRLRSLASYLEKKT